MAYLMNKNFFLEVEQGNIPGWSHTRKFGKIFGVGTTLTPITGTGLYQTPTSAQSLEILSSSVNDTSAGSGARTVYVEGLDANFALQSTTATMNGTTAVALTGTWTRVFRIYVVTSGTYGSATASSHAGTITVRNSGAGVSWGQLYVDSGYGLGQSLIGAYTVPVGYTAYVYPSYLSVESSKVVSAYFFKRENADDVAAPYDAIRTQISLELVGGINYIDTDMCLGAFTAKTDIGWMCKTSASTANVSVSFDIYLKAT
jgi:hypothetical protein